MNHNFTRIIALMAILIFPAMVFAQCMVYPVAFSQRINEAHSAILGKVTEQHCYADDRGNIYTSNKIQVTAWIKNHSAETEVYVITLGGVLNGKAQITNPAVQLKKGDEYFLMLENNNTVCDDKNLRAASPSKIQALPFADAQGALLYQDEEYFDFFEGKLTESALLQKISTIAGLQPKRPDGSMYVARAFGNLTTNTNDITSFGPNPTNAGTINPSEYLTINGSGFGTTPGTVQFPNADNGGSTYIEPPNTSDYVSWTDNQIIVKVPTGSSANAGTGNFLVNGTFQSPQQLTIGYAQISINSDFSGFATPTRQRYYLRNLDGQGGYTFTYNTNFAINTAAVAAFERTLNTWKCNTGMNWRAAGTTTLGYADDNVNVVLYDATLPAGVLARATSRFSGSALTGTCDLQNTMWWLKEIDMQVRETGVTWQYGPALATGSQYDFETVLLHELGHGHGLAHRIAPGQLMNYALANASNIRTPAAVEIQGAQNKVGYSTIATCFNPTGSGTPMIAASCSLPVKLTTFTGELKSYGVELNWRTQTEINSDRFEVQRSNNSVEFSPIGSVNAKGSTSSENAYRFIDANVNKGVNYYRLKMIDKDGSYEYSSVVAIKVNEPVRSFSVYPNPVKDQLQLSSTTKTSLNLIDGNGKVVRKVQVDIGTNSIDVNNLSSGIYYLSDQITATKLRILIMH
jgi:hypothetical protein